MNTTAKLAEKATEPVSQVKKKTKLTTLNLVLDPGTSCTKSIYSKGRKGNPKYLISNAFIYQGTNSKPSPSHAYVKLQDEDEYYIVDNGTAQSESLGSIKQLKSESIIYKILGVIGEIAELEKLNSTFILRITLLLPISETRDRQYIESELTHALSNFDYCNKSYQVEINSLRFEEEGKGVYSLLSRSLSKEEVSNQSTACLMFGYRNTSLILIENDKLNHAVSHSTNLGFYKYLDLVAKHSSGLYREDIQKAIATVPVYGKRNYQMVLQGFNSQIDIPVLLRSSGAKHREREMLMIKNAISAADEEYWMLINGWLEEKLPHLSHLDRVVYCGGSTSFIEEPLERFFKDWDGELVNTNSISLEMMNRLDLTSLNQKKFIKQCLPIRLADAWGEFVNLNNIRI